MLNTFVCVVYHSISHAVYAWVDGNLYKYRCGFVTDRNIIISVAVLVTFLIHRKFYLKFQRNFRQYFASFLSYFPASQKKLRNYIYYALRYFHFCQNFEIAMLVEILNSVEKFRKDSIDL